MNVEPYTMPAGAGGAPPPPGDDPGRRAELRRRSRTWFFISLASFVGFGCGNCLGLIGALLCFLALQAAERGPLADAESKLRWGKIITVVGAVIATATAAFAVYYSFLRVPG